MPTVQMPDGSHVDLPDNPSPELKKAVQAKVELQGLQAQRERVFATATKARDTARPGQHWLFDATSPELDAIDGEISKRKDVIAKAKAETGGFVDKAKYYAGQGASAIARGLLQLPAMAASAGMATDPQRYANHSSGEPLADVGKLGMQPQTTGEKYTARAIEGAAGALTSPASAGAGLLRNMTTSAISSMSSEATADIFGDNPITRILGGVLGGGLTSLAMAPKTTRADLVREATQGSTEAQLRDAQALMRESKAAGVPLNLSQAMPKGSNIDEMVSALAQNRAGKMTAETLHNQPGVTSTGVGLEISQLPGKVLTPQEAANSVQEATTKVIKDVKAARTNLTSPLYNAGGDLGMSAPKEFGNTIDRFVNSAGVSPKVAQQALALKEELLASSANGKPRTQATDIKAAIDSFRGGIKNTLNPLDPKEQGQMKFLVDRLYQQLGTKSIPVAAGNAIYSQVSENVVDPLKKSVVGRLAGTAGAQADKEAVVSRLNSVFDNGTLPGAKSSDILTLEKSLRNSGQAEVFQDAAKTWLANKLATATKTQGGRLAEHTAGNLEAAFVKDPKAQQGLRDTLVALARSQGLPDASLLNGMQNMMKYVSAAARRPGPVAGTSPQQLEEASRSRIFGGIGNFSMMQPIRQPFKAIDEALNHDAYSFMDKLLNTPEGVDVLIKMGKEPTVSKTTAQSLATVVGTAAGAEAGK